MSHTQPQLCSHCKAMEALALHLPIFLKTWCIFWYIEIFCMHRAVYFCGSPIWKFYVNLQCKNYYLFNIKVKSVRICKKLSTSSHDVAIGLNSQIKWHCSNRTIDGYVSLYSWQNEGYEITAYAECYYFKTAIPYIHHNTRGGSICNTIVIFWIHISPHQLHQFGHLDQEVIWPLPDYHLSLHCLASSQFPMGVGGGGDENN